MKIKYLGIRFDFSFKFSLLLYENISDKELSIDNGTASVVYVRELRVFDLYKMSY